MSLLERISNLVTANINHLLDTAEDPEVMIKQLIRDMEGSIIELRRETVRAVARDKQLQKQIAASRQLLFDLEAKAKLALQNGEEVLAREVLARKVHTGKTLKSLEESQKGATGTAARLKSDLARLEDQAQAARRKKEELIRRKQQAEDQLRSQRAARRSVDTLSAAADSLAGMAESGAANLEDEIGELEAQAEAERELYDEDMKKQLDLDRLQEEEAVEVELKRLKNEM